ncbi:MAG: hypothetical protein JXC31_00940 [Acholeplasmataceae bacterium]|nr:hypothetical protein [Acholeplasmataceae bacterium]
MLKWFGRILYIVVISILSLQIYSYAYYSKLQDYYAENVIEHIDDDAVYLNGINTLMGIDYYRSSPVLYEYIKDDGDYQLSVKAYAVGITSDDVTYDGFFILVNNVQITKDDVQVVDPIIKITVELDEDTLLVDNELTNTGSIYFDPQQPFAYYNVPVLFLFDAKDYLQMREDDEDLTPIPNTFSNLTRIEVSYSDRTIDEDDQFIYEEVPLFLATTIDTQESAINKDLSLSIDVDDYRLRSKFADQVPTESEISSFNLITERGDMSPYNWVIWRTMLIYLLVVALVTYLLFFHKRVRDYYKTKNYGRRKDGTLIDNTNSIFKDVNDKDKDGK